MRSERFNLKSNDTGTDVQATSLALPIVLLASLAYLLIKAFVICLLWDWYFVSHFDLKPLTMPVAYGICLLGQLFIGIRHNKSQKDILLWLIVPFVTLFFGWVGTFFM